MNTNTRRFRSVVLAAIASLPALVLQSAIALGGPAPAPGIPDHYVGAGIRGGSEDSTAGVLDSKFKLVGVGHLDLSTRPALMRGGYDTEWRLPLTLDSPKNKRGFSVFGGGGLAYNMDGIDEVDWMATGGVDVALQRRLVVNLTLNYIWQSAISDDDTELMASLNYGF